MSVFNENSKVNEHPNLNTFDGSFMNHLTMKMGYLYPAFVKEVVPGDSFDISCLFGLKFMPMVFPIQSNIKARMHFFYVRNRNICDEWENLISGLPDKNGNTIVHPYLASDNPTEFTTGSLADYLNVPTTKASLFSDFNLIHQDYNIDPHLVESVQVSLTPNTQDTNYPLQTGRHVVAGHYDYGINMSNITSSHFGERMGFDQTRLPNVCFIYRTRLTVSMLNRINETGELRLMFPDFSGRLVSMSDVTPFVGSFDADFMHFTLHGCGSFLSTQNNVHKFSFNYDSVISEVLGMDNDGDAAPFNLYLAFAVKDGANLADSIRSAGSYFPSFAYIQSTEPRIVDSDAVYRNGVVSLNALPFRAYEQCCRAFYCDDVLQPMLDPVTDMPVFNQFVRNTSSGADHLKYELYKCNYESDFLTTCRPSPQMGNAPLVGMTALGNITIQDENGITTASATIDNDGTITNVVLTSPAASVEHARTAMNIASAGMSINDFRNANALQKFLETSLRKGYKYLDFIAGHFGKSPDYKEFKLPEFIGGFVEPVKTFSLTNMAQTDNMQLGEFVGQASCSGGSKHSIHHYCDDFGYIIGILSIVPTPTYQTLLPKHFLHSQQLDYYFPEFSNIGMQPVPYKEVAPVFCDNASDANATFGYQRPNYDLVANVDECHGQFRSTLANFLIQRYFSGLPELGDRFLQVDPMECNQVFSYTSPNDDNIIGQVAFDVKMKRPIPRITIPSIR